MNQVKQYIKKPVKVFAIQYNGNSDKARIEEFVGKELKVELESETAYVAGQGPPYFSLLIETKEGVMKAMPGDYIIQEPFPTGDRDFYPCKPDIFDQNYDLVEINHKSSEVSTNKRKHSDFTNMELFRFIYKSRYLFEYTDFHGSIFIAEVIDELRHRGIDANQLDFVKIFDLENRKSMYLQKQKREEEEFEKQIEKIYYRKALKRVQFYAYATVFFMCLTLLCLYYGIYQFPDWSVSAEGQLIQFSFWIDLCITIVLLTLLIVKNKEVNTLQKNIDELSKT